MKRMHAVFWVFLILPGILLSGGCATETRLEPAPSAALQGGDDWIEVRYGGVLVRANPDAWTGFPEIVEKVTPMKVEIFNDHGGPIRILYNNFSMVSETGRRYSALPPYEIEGSIARYEFVNPTHGLERRELSVSPHQRLYYPELPGGMGWGYGDPCYYSCYGRIWRELELPTEKMVNKALPEGELGDGGTVSGFLYMERVESAERVEFRADLVDADDGYIFGTVSLPFVVQ